MDITKEKTLTLPGFLVIGAMKAGTTTLCSDLKAHPAIYFPKVKEPHTLLKEEVLTEKGKKNYAALFKWATDGQMCGEGSTGYSKWGPSPVVAHRAKQVLGEHLKIIYIVRDPVSRAISHHKHNCRAGKAPANFKQALEENPLILKCSLYGMQLQPWFEVFGPENICVVHFESYVRDRTGTIQAIARFLGVGEQPVQLDEQKRYNVGEEQKLMPEKFRGFKSKIARSQWYKRNLAPYISDQLRKWVRNTIYVQPNYQADPPTPKDIDDLIDRFESDLGSLKQLVSQQLPWWSPDSLREKHLP